MKKLLVLLVIASLATFANATMNLSIGVGGVTTVEEITIAPSDHLVLSIYADGFADGDGGYFALVGDNALGLISGGEAIVPPAPNMTMMVEPLDYAPYFPGVSGAYFTIDTSTSGATAPAGTYIGSIDFHCEGPGDVLVQLYMAGDWTPEGAILLDSLVIHQVIPEPATIALLCLGGLLLRKRS